jgi:hypothetical protein
MTQNASMGVAALSKQLKIHQSKQGRLTKLHPGIQWKQEGNGRDKQINTAR